MKLADPSLLKDRCLVDGKRVGRIVQHDLRVLHSRPSSLLFWNGVALRERQRPRSVTATIDISNLRHSAKRLVHQGSDDFSPGGASRLSGCAFAFAGRGAGGL
jgi:hypothetical protein